MQKRRAWFGLVGAFLSCLFSSGCSKRQTSIRVTIALEPNGTPPEDVVLKAYDRFGVVIRSADLGAGTKLPGDVLVLYSPNGGVARILIEGYNQDTLALSGFGSVSLVVGKETPLTVTLSATLPGDFDNDGLPDAIDNCPSAANPDQKSRGGADAGDACNAAAVDGGIGDAAPGALCGNGQMDPGEACDDGTNNGDSADDNATCTSHCQKRAPCGDRSGALAAAINPEDGHCLVAWPTTSDWMSAERSCQSAGGNLASITSSSENDLVRSLIGSSEMWIGLSSPPTAVGSTQNFRWVTLESKSFDGFASGEPDNAGAQEECVSFNPQAGWKDQPCGFPRENHGYICTYLPPSPATALGHVCEMSCGNGVVELGEECDPPGSSCTASCKKMRTCDDASFISPMTGHCYFLAKRGVKLATQNYSAATSTCPIGSHLATLNEPGETEAALRALTAGTAMFSPAGAIIAWIGLSDSSALPIFAWSSNSEIFNSRRYHGFVAPSPDIDVSIAGQDCVALILDTASPGTDDGWRDRACTDTYYALCERE